MKTWFTIFVIAGTVALVTLVFPIGGVQGLATIIANSALVGIIVSALASNE